jgi:dihydroxyacetone kinase-like predicted kinase
MEMEDTPALSAHMDKLETHRRLTSVWILQAAQQQIKSNLLLILLHVVDARLANIQLLSQMLQELTVLEDHLPSVPIAPPDNQMMDIHVRTAHQDKLLAQPTLRHAILQHVLETNKSEQPSTTSAVELVRLANGQYIWQTLQELNAFLDQELSAHHVPRDNLTMDTVA